LARVASLEDAVAEYVRDGDTVALESSAHLIPYAAGHEIIRQGRRDLALVRLTPDLICDQLIGMGCAQKLIFSWSGNTGVGSLHRFRDAAENGWPRPLELEEHGHAGMVNAYAAGAADLPLAVVRGYVGSDLAKLGARVRFVTCPFTGEELAAVRSIRPDVAVIHAQKADRRGNVLLWGALGVQKEATLAAEEVIVTVEEIVDDLEAWPGACVLPARNVSAVCPVPGGARPSRAPGYYQRDEGFHRAWDKIARDREVFLAWMRRHVLDAADDAGVRHPPPETRIGVPLRGTTPPPREHAAFSATEMMTVAAARMLENGAVCLVGVGLPSTAASLARLTHAPDLVLIGETDPTAADPQASPLSRGGSGQTLGAELSIATREIYRYWLQGGRVDLGLVSAAQVDRFGNLNASFVGGTYAQPRVRLPGAGGSPEIAAMAGEVLVVMRQDRRSFVDRLDFVTSAGHLRGGGARRRGGLSGKGPTAIVTDLGILTPDPATKEFTLTSIHPGVSVEQVRAATGWDLKVAPGVATTPMPEARELRALRGLAAPGLEGFGAVA
jgi:glutaconate CoA-transferase subunit A